MAHVKEFSVEEKLTSLVTLQKIESKLDELHILKGELPMEVADLEDEIQGFHARQTRIEEEINGVTEFIEQRKLAIKEAEAMIKKYQSIFLFTRPAMATIATWTGTQKVSAVLEPRCSQPYSSYTLPSF